MVNEKYRLKKFKDGRVVLRSKERLMPSGLHSKALSFCFITGTVVLSLCGALPLMLLAVTGGITVAALLTKQSTDRLLNRLAILAGGWRVLFIALAIAFSLSLVAHGQPAHAQLFEGAKGAAESGIGTYIGAEESTSLIDTITFGMWALAAVGGIAVIAGGATQNIQVLIGGLVLFFGMAVLIGVLEFTDGLLFA